MNHEGEINVLLVDDESAVCDTLNDYLEDYGFNISSVGNSKEAIEILSEEKFDIALIDMRLPYMDGDTLILKAHELQPDLRFLIHTGSAAYEVTKELYKIGIRKKHVFFKPIKDLSLIRDAITDLMKNGKKDNGR